MKLKTLMLAMPILLAVALPSNAAPPRSPEGGDGPSDKAADCLYKTLVKTFKATPSTVNPGGSTTLIWDVKIPEKCPVALYVNGRRVSSRGSLAVMPNRQTVNYTLEGRMAGGRGVLASTRVIVNPRSCRQLEVPETLLRGPINSAIGAYFSARKNLKPTVRSQISITPKGLRIDTQFKVDILLYPDPKVDLDMGFTFPVNNGEVQPKYTFFKPRTSSKLLDGKIKQKIFGQRDEILATVKLASNRLLASYIRSNERLFSVETLNNSARFTFCPHRRRSGVQLPSTPQLLPSS